MFAARAMAASVSVFVIVYCAMSVAVCVTWRRLWWYGRRHAPASVANLLFHIRLLPILSAVAITGAFAVPSFLLLEPRTIHEAVGEAPLLLSVLGIVLVAYGSVNAAQALRRSSRAVSAWRRGALRVKASAPVPVLQVTGAAPAMTAAGIIRPAILLSATAQGLLSSNELHTALNHELVHVRRRDNLRKLLLRCVTFPGMAGLEAAWAEATEMAADDAAVSSSSEALDLASALIKLSRVHPHCPPPELTATLVQSPISVMNARIERLLGWTEKQDQDVRKPSAWYGYSVAVVVLMLVAVVYSQILVDLHTATEWLMR